MWSGVPTCLGGLRRLLTAGLQPGLLGPGHIVRGAPWDGPSASGGGGNRALQRRLGKLRVLGQEYAGLELGGTHDRLALLDSLRRLRTTLASKVRATLRAEDQGRLREWHAWLEESLDLRPGGSARRGGYAVRRPLQLAEDILEGALGRLDARHGASEWPPGVPALFWAEAHPTKQLVGPPAPGQVRRGASGKAAPAGRESGAMSGPAGARRVSSAAVVHKAQAWSTSPVDRAARQPASRGSRGRCTRGS